MDETQLLEAVREHPEWSYALEITDRFNASQRIDFAARLATSARAIAERLDESCPDCGQSWDEHDLRGRGASFNGCPTQGGENK